MSDSNISPRDVKILFALTIAVVSISLIFPMMGFGSTGADDPREIPTMDIDTSQYDFAGQFPTRPNTESSGTVRFGASSSPTEQLQPFYQANNTASFGEPPGTIYETTDISTYDSLVAVVETNPNYDGETDENIYRISLIATNSEIPTTQFGAIDTENISLSSPEWVTSQTFSGDDVGQTYDLTAMTASGTPEIRGTVRFTVTEAVTITNTTTGEDLAASVRYDTVSLDTPDSGGLLSGVPIVGGLVEGGSGILAGIVLLVEQIAWVFGTIVSLIVNAISTVAQTFGFVASLLGFVSGGYATVVATAPGGLASLILAFPGLLLGIQVIRLTLVFVNAVWVG